MTAGFRNYIKAFIIYLFILVCVLCHLFTYIYFGCSWDSIQRNTYIYIFFPVPSGISHSVLSDMQTIEQETPTVGKPKKKYTDDVEDSYFSSSSSR